MSFIQLNLDPNINKAIAACGYTKPTSIQARSIPDILSGRDVIASAQTGTGKTAAFVLPALHRLSLQKSSKKTCVLILTPTRELASQITKAASLYGKYLRFNIVSLVGGMPYHAQIRDLARGADIIVATPGRLLDHIEQKRVDLSHIEMLVLDEADRMLDMGFIDDVQAIAKLTPSKRQTLLFSATVDNQLATIVRHLLNKPIRIDLSNEKIATPKIEQSFYKVAGLQQKLRLLVHMIGKEQIFKAIIFSATKIQADKIATQLRSYGFSTAALHGDLRQNVRQRTLEQFRRGQIQFLVATDVAARGIDVSDITHVINYDLPRFCEDYVHRIGRTGRAGKSGAAISFVSPTDVRHLQRIERYTNQRFKVIQHVTIDEASMPEQRDIPEKNETSSRGQQYERKKRYASGDDHYAAAGSTKRFARGDSAKRYAGGEDTGKRFSRGDSAKRYAGGEDTGKRFSRGDAAKRYAVSEDTGKRFARGDSAKRYAGGEESGKRFARGDSAKRYAGGEESGKRFARGDSAKRYAGGEETGKRFARGDSAKRYAGGEETGKRFARGDSAKRYAGGEETGKRFARSDSAKRYAGGEESGKRHASRGAGKPYAGKEGGKRRAAAETGKPTYHKNSSAQEKSRKGFKTRSAKKDNHADKA